MRLSGLILAVFSAFSGPLQAQIPGAGLQKINHIIVIYQDTWSFDGLNGSFPGAEGIQSPDAQFHQVDSQENPITDLPQPI